MSIIRNDCHSVVMLTADGQIDRRILLEAVSLESAGWKVSIIAMPKPGSHAGDDPRVIRINANQKPVSLNNFILSLYRWFRKYGPSNGTSARRMKGVLWRGLMGGRSILVNLFAEEAIRLSPKVVVAHDLPMLPIACNIARGFGAKIVYDSHELYCEQEFSAKERKDWAALEGRYIKKCDAVITVNPLIAHELKTRYNLNIVHIIYNAERLYEPPSRNLLFHKAFNLQEGDSVLLYQGGINPGRGIEKLTEAVMHLQDERIHFILLGDGELKGHLQQRYGGNKCIHFHDPVPQDSLLDYTSSADAGVIPYNATCLNNYLCSPNKLFEYIAAGIPVIANDLPEIKRIISMYDIGLVKNFSSAIVISDCINMFMHDRNKLLQWKANALKARLDLCWEKEGSKLIQIFEEFR